MRPTRAGRIQALSTIVQCRLSRFAFLRAAIPILTHLCRPRTKHTFGEHREKQLFSGHRVTTSFQPRPAWALSARQTRPERRCNRKGLERGLPGVWLNMSWCFGPQFFQRETALAAAAMRAAAAPMRLATVVIISLVSCATCNSCAGRWDGCQGSPAAHSFAASGSDVPIMGINRR